MPVWNDLGMLWRIAGEIDVRAIQEAAVQTPRLALVGPLEPLGLLQGYLQQGPRTAGQPVTTPPTYRLPLSFSDVAALANYDLRVAVLEQIDQARRDDLQALTRQPAPLLALLDRSGADGDGLAEGPVGPLPVLVCTLADRESVRRVVWPAFEAAIHGRELAWARAYPGLRPPVCRRLILDTCLVNATYALGTGIAEMIPPFTVPFAVADMVILTKNQLILAYKIAMAMGDTGSLQDLLPKFASVVGAGFLWRQVARELLALLPGGVAWKTAVAYAGTYATGQAIYHWYVYEEHLTPAELKAAFNEGLRRGKEAAADLVERARRRQEPPALLEGSGAAAHVAASAAPERPAKRPARKLRLPVPPKRR